MFDSLWPYGLQHARLLCPLLVISRSLLKFMSIELVILSNNLILCHLLFLLTSIFPSRRVFSNELAFLIRWPKYWSFSISLSNEYLGLISFRIDWFYLLALQGTLRNLLQYHNLKASILQLSTFLSGPTLTSIHTGRTMVLTIQNFVSDVMSLLFNTLPRTVITSLPRSKCLLISWLQSPSAVILVHKKIISVSFHFFLFLYAMMWWHWMAWS